jgi:hypothetical protein
MSARLRRRSRLGGPPLPVAGWSGGHRTEKLWALQPAIGTVHIEPYLLGLFDGERCWNAGSLGHPAIRSGSQDSGDELGERSGARSGSMWSAPGTTTGLQPGIRAAIWSGQLATIGYSGSPRIIIAGRCLAAATARIALQSLALLRLRPG